MVKGPARNAQFYFITEHVMPKYNIRSFQDALNTGRQLWKNLTDEEKAPWKAKEQQWKAYMRGPAGDKYRKDCSGNNMQEEFDKQKQKEEFEEYVRKEAVNYVKPREEVLDQPFYFIAFEYALQDDYGKYYPCEVGLVKYSLKRGIEKSVHYFLKPPDYPLGTKAAAKKHSEERHKIPYLGFEKATDGYSAVFAHMRDVLLNTSAGASNGASSGYPPIYCMPGDVEMNRNCLDVLFERAQRHESEKIEVVASASLLLIGLFGSEVCGEAKALEILSSTTFDHEKGVACDWHYDLECINCALATARKIAFALSDSLKTTYNLTLTPNHLPTVAQLPYSSTAQTVAFEAPRSKKAWKFGGSSVVSSAVSSTTTSRYADSVVSEYAPRAGSNARSSSDYNWDSGNVSEGFSQLSIAAGRGQSGFASAVNAPTSRPGPPSNQRSSRNEDDEWTTVSTNRNRSHQPVQDDWESGDRIARNLNVQQSSASWDDDENDFPINPKPASAPIARPNPWGNPSGSSVASRPTALDDEDDETWEGASFTSSTAYSAQQGLAQGASDDFPALSSNPYARAPAAGRGRGLSMNGR